MQSHLFLLIAPFFVSGILTSYPPLCLGSHYRCNSFKVLPLAQTCHASCLLPRPAPPFHVASAGVSYDWPRNSSLLCINCAHRKSQNSVTVYLYTYLHLSLSLSPFVQRCMMLQCPRQQLAVILFDGCAAPVSGPRWCFPAFRKKC